MRNCGSSLGSPSPPAVARVAIALTLTMALGVLVHAQTSAAEAYRQLREREAVLRQQIDQPGPGAASTQVLTNLRLIVGDYEALSKTHRTTGYGDNALWQAALLAGDAFWSFGESRDRQTALWLLSELAGRFPASSLNSQAPAYRDRLQRATPAATTRTAAAPVPVTTPKSVPPSTPSATTGTHGATLTAIRREMLPDVVRVTLFLEEETAFVTERLDGPPRLSIDLRDTRVVYALKDARLPFQDGVIKPVRIGPFERGRTRVVLDLTADAGRASIYPVYTPYRLVIDVARSARAPSLIAKAEPTASAGQQAAAAAKSPAARAPAAQPAASARAAATPQLRAQPPSGPQVRAQPAAAGRSVSLSRQLGLSAARIVIDAGHGGHDPGAQGDDLDEAEVVLDVALRLEQLLSAVPGVDVVMTRRKHEYVALEERTAIANRAGADLFLSIHANASPNTNARGVETYFLNFAPNAEAEAIAARENAGSTRTMRSLTDSVRAIVVNDKLDESKDFATHVQSSLYATLRKTNRQTKNLGVKQAPFQVLIGATMPSVLAEISFVTHEREGELLKTDKYRDQIATALFDGIMAYQRSLKSVAVVAEK